MEETMKILESKSQVDSALHIANKNREKNKKALDV